MVEDMGNDTLMEHGKRELRKLEWDMKDTIGGEIGELAKRNGRLGATKVNLC